MKTINEKFIRKGMTIAFMTLFFASISSVRSIMATSTCILTFFLDKTNDILYYYFQKEGCSDIFRAILDHDGISFTALLESSGLPRTTLARRIKMLIETNLIIGVVSSG